MIAGKLLNRLNPDRSRHAANKSASAARRFMREGFHVAKKPNGMPLISRTHYEEVMSGKPTSAPSDKNTAVPNIAKFRRQFSG